MKRIWILLFVFAVITCILWWGVFYYNDRRRTLMLDSWNDLQLQSARDAARITKEWLEMRIQQQGVPKEIAEQEVFKKFIEPVLHLKNGDAWIYNREYVIYDKMSYFPEIYRGKSIRELFDIQREKGAYHYEKLCDGVMNGVEGKGWYVWLPRKGREYVAWTPVQLDDDVWTVGISTPEAEIIDHFGLDVQFRIELMAVTIISGLIFAVFLLVVFQMRRDRAVLDVMRKNAIQLNRTNQELSYQLSQRERAEAERERLMRELKKKYRQERDAWKEISFRAAHKMGNAIFGLRGDIDWLQVVCDKKPLNEKELLAAIREAREGLNEANRIVREFKKYYRPDELKTEPVDINELLNRAVAQVEKAAGPGVAIQQILDKSLPALLLDRTKFKQCITELIENACYFIDYKGNIHVETKRAVKSDLDLLGMNGEAVSIFIRDDGKGVPAENKSMLFHPFFSTSAKGSGLGLAIVQQYVEMHGGRIHETGEYGTGACFRIVLPVTPIDGPHGVEG